MSPDGADGAQPALLQEKLDEHGMQDQGEQVVQWKSNNSDHPRHWRTWKKLFNASLICWLEMLMTLISTAGVSRSSCFSFIMIYVAHTGINLDIGL